MTPKVHLMWNHVEHQIKLPGGLGWKREDWIEHMHQITYRVRDQSRTMQNKEFRVVSISQAHQQNTEPAFDKHILEVDHDTYMGPRAGYMTTTAERKTKREEM